MSQTQRRSSRHGAASKARTQPVILKSRKRKASENALDQELIKTKLSKGNMDEPKPLEDVTSTSLNVERERAITPEVTPDEYNSCRGLTCYPTPQAIRPAPLPHLDWADKEQLWEYMRRKDTRYKNRKTSDLITRHPALQPRMRSILLDWLTEVSEVYKLHRETYYLSADYIDRYLSDTTNIPKAQLQLIGITCLFIASKIEEIYPPKLSDFSYVTDGACTDEEILEKELVILKKLNWDLTPITVNSWMNTYLQIINCINKERMSDTSANLDFIFPQYSGLNFVQLSRLMDLCVLDTGCLKFHSSVMAATALCYLTSPSTACLVSGLELNDLQKCYNWMSPFAHTIQDLHLAPLKMFSQIPNDDSHNIQTHAIDLDTLDVVYNRLALQSELRASPSSVRIPPEVLTPPKTDEKRECATHLHT